MGLLGVYDEDEPFFKTGGSMYSPPIILPRKTHNTVAQFCERITQLEKAESGFVKLYCAEVLKTPLNTLLRNPIDLDFDDTCTFEWDLGWRLIQSSKVVIKYNKPKGGLFTSNQYTPIVKDSFSSAFHAVLQQIQQGVFSSKHSGVINLSGHVGHGQIGDGGAKALAHALQTAACQRLDKLTIDLSKNAITALGEQALWDAIVSGNCPYNLEIKGLSPAFSVLMCLNSFMQSVAQLPHLKQLPLEVLVLIGSHLGLVNDRETYQRVQNAYNANLNTEDYSKREIEQWAFIQKRLLNEVPAEVSRALFFPFEFNQSWVLISDVLYEGIKSEIKTAFQKIVSTLSHAHKTVLLEHGATILSECMGVFNNVEGRSFNVLDGTGLQYSGLKKLFYEALSIKAYELGKLLIAPTLFSSDKTKSASHDELKGNPESRMQDMIFFFYTTIAKKATLFQLDVLLADSQNKECPGMQLLRDKGLFKKYCDTLVQLKNDKMAIEAVKLHCTM